MVRSLACVFLSFATSAAETIFVEPCLATNIMAAEKHELDNMKHITQSTFISAVSSIEAVLSPRGGGALIPAGYNPFGYKITALGEQFLEIHKNCLESDVGRFIASLKNKRKSYATLQQEWLEIVRVSKSGQTMRIYRTMKEMIDFCIAARFID